MTSIDVLADLTNEDINKVFAVMQPSPDVHGAFANRRERAADTVLAATCDFGSRALLVRAQLAYNIVGDMVLLRRAVQKARALLGRGQTGDRLDMSSRPPSARPSSARPEASKPPPFGCHHYFLAPFHECYH